MLKIANLLFHDKIKDVLSLVKNYNLQSPIFVPSHNLRNNNIFNFCTNCIGFIYDDEINLYKKYKNKFVYINTKNNFFNGKKSIQAKRLWIQNYCDKNNIEKAFLIDDDVKPFLTYKNGIIKLIDGLKILELLSYEMNLTLCTFNAHNDYCNNVYNKIYNPCGSMFINFKHLKDNNIYFKNLKIHEDIALWCGCLNKKLNVLSINNIKYNFYYETHPHLDLIEDTLLMHPQIKGYFTIDQ